MVAKAGKLQRTIVSALALALLGGPMTVRAESVKLPETIAEHIAMAEQYHAKAKAYLEEVQFHRQMMAEYQKTHPDRKSGARNPWTVEMEEHCRKIIAHARPLAEEAEFMARFHRARAKELEAK